MEFWLILKQAKRNLEIIKWIQKEVRRDGKKTPKKVCPKPIP
jgi:hypothetical protein